MVCPAVGVGHGSSVDTLQGVSMLVCTHAVLQTHRVQLCRVVCCSTPKGCVPHRFQPARHSMVLCVELLTLSGGRNGPVGVTECVLPRP
jgi:hypothetical protein